MPDYQVSGEDEGGIWVKSGGVRGKEMAENLCLGFGCWGKGFFAKVSYSGLNLNQNQATKPQTVQIVRQGEATPYWFKVNLL